MGFMTLLSVAVGISMDAFAVSVCKGLKMRKLNYGHMIVTALFFGGFQAFMPFIGWLLGSRFEEYIKSFDHWIAFGLLAFIGVKMFIESFRSDDEEDGIEINRLDFRELTVLAVATSIDALAAGITFAFLNVSVIPSVTVIGITTFILSCAGVYTGNKFGAEYKNRAEMAGGIILVLIGVKILLEHLGISG